MATGIVHNPNVKSSYGSSDLLNAQVTFDSDNTSIEVRGAITIFTFVTDNIVVGTSWTHLATLPASLIPPASANAIGMSGNSTPVQLKIWSANGKIEARAGSNTSNSPVRGTFVWCNN